MGGTGKPAMVLKVTNEEYSAWSRFGNIQRMEWNYYKYNDYVLFALEVYFSIPGKTVLFRQYFDPADTATTALLNSWVSLEGDDVVFFVGDANLNYINGPTPNKTAALEVLSDAKAELAKIAQKSTFSSAYRTWVNIAPLYEEVPQLEY
jgi:hypothetical protein